MSHYEHDIPAYQWSLAAFHKFIDELDAAWERAQQAGPVTLQQRIEVRGRRWQLVKTTHDLENLIRVASQQRRCR
ncbi:hypothetical protein XPR_1958 [Xanthomonas arboricola pv. pruni MAFF 301420]|uniref:Uncharacterized protein n=2 Tax=Xanthomonas arboricola pv. pruni TaxID=69929 RepID=W4SGN2_9XANT|nr:hypothetical protein XPU_0120 [Xanthomonas arboricola pv. pruni str. MAFF 311562]GAE55323.1 hypothetical protein XPR_1958 [Xanthomonas arboricola pv. pruni MAFF 301420]GAE59970.1 hypothetical protein XPN_1876 [Xanthomonas arboricola pv. pruni MAFF 301427]